MGEMGCGGFCKEDTQLILSSICVMMLQALVDQHDTRLTITQSTTEAVEDAAPVQDRLRVRAPASGHALAQPLSLARL